MGNMERSSGVGGVEMDWCMLRGWFRIAIAKLEPMNGQPMPHARFEVPFLGPENRLKSGFACTGLLCSVKFLSALVKVHLCIPISRNFAMHMGKVLTGDRPPLLSSQAGGQGRHALLTLALAFGPLSQIISGK